MWFALAAMALQAKGQMDAGAAEEAMARYNAGLMDMQASNIEANRVYSSQRQQEQIKEAHAKTIGQASKQGANWSSVSRMMMLNKSYYNMQIDSHIMDYNATMEAKNLRSQASQMRKTGKNSAQTANYGAGASLLSNVGGKYAQGAGASAGSSGAGASAGSSGATSTGFEGGQTFG